MWQWVARGNIQQISYIPHIEQHSPFGLMLLRLGNVTTICMYVCMCVSTHVLYVYVYSCMYGIFNMLHDTLATSLAYFNTSQFDGEIIDNRPTEKGLETCSFFAISHSGARYGHMIYKWR